MPRSLGRHQIGFSQRTGRKVRARDLVEDGERRGLIVDRREADKEHPQKFAKAIPADRPSLLPSIPEAKTEAVRVLFGYSTVSETLWQPRSVLPAISVSQGACLLTIQGSSGTISVYLIAESGARLLTEAGEFLTGTIPDVGSGSEVYTV